MDRFALFQLPYVACSEVMKMFSLFEITMLSMCSQRTQKWLKTFRIPRDAVTVNVFYCSGPAVRLFDLSSKKSLYYYIVPPPNPNQQSIKIGNSMVPMSIELKPSGYCMHLYFENQIEGLKMVTEYFCSFFEKNVNDIHLSYCSIPNHLVIITEWLLQRQGAIRQFHIELLNASDTVARNLLDKSRTASHVTLSISVSPQFKFNFEFKKDGKVYIDFGSWFTLENLLNVNCEHLTLLKTPLTNMDINLFIKHWMTSDLKFHSVKIYPKEVLNLDVIVSEIPVVRRERRDCFDVTNNKIVTIFNGLEVKQNDGLKTATISINDDPLNEFGRFWMIVWDTFEF